MLIISSYFPNLGHPQGNTYGMHVNNKHTQTHTWHWHLQDERIRSWQPSRCSGNLKDLPTWEALVSIDTRTADKDRVSGPSLCWRQPVKQTIGMQGMIIIQNESWDHWHPTRMSVKGSQKLYLRWVLSKNLLRQGRSQECFHTEVLDCVEIQKHDMGIISWTARHSLWRCCRVQAAAVGRESLLLLLMLIAIPPLTLNAFCINITSYLFLQSSAVSDNALQNRRNWIEDQEYTYTG